MVILPLVLIVLLVVIALAVVLLPLWHRSTDGRPPSAGLDHLSTRDELMARRDALYTALKDAEFDHEMGKLGEEDYRALRTRTMREAAEVLRQIDRLTPEAEAEIEREIEQAVAQLRTGVAGSGQTALPPGAVQAIEAEIATLVRHGDASGRQDQPACPNCGQTYRAGDAFCVHCGTPLSSIVPCVRKGAQGAGGTIRDRR